jgi:hypothetical protein
LRANFRKLALTAGSSKVGWKTRFEPFMKGKCTLGEDI